MEWNIAADFMKRHPLHLGVLLMQWGKTITRKLLEACIVGGELLERRPSVWKHFGRDVNSYVTWVMEQMAKRGPKNRDKPLNFDCNGACCVQAAGVFWLQK